MTDPQQIRYHILMEILAITWIPMHVQHKRPLKIVEWLFFKTHKKTER